MNIYQNVPRAIRQITVLPGVKKGAVKERKKKRNRSEISRKPQRNDMCSLFLRDSAREGSETRRRMAVRRKEGCDSNKRKREDKWENTGREQ